MPNIANLQNEALAAYAKLSQEVGFSPDLPETHEALAKALATVPESHAKHVEVIETFIASAGFSALGDAMSISGVIYGLRNPSVGVEQTATGRAGKAPGSGGAVGGDSNAIYARFLDPETRLTPRADGSVRPLYELPSFASMKNAFAGEMGSWSDFPADVANIAHRLEAWNHRTAVALEAMPVAGVARQAIEIGVMISDALALLRMVNTKRLDDWTNSTESADEAMLAFESWRRAFYDRCDALSYLVSEALTATDFVTPERSTIAALVGNSRKLTELLGARNYLWGSVGLIYGASRVAFRERKFLSALLSRQARRKGVTFPWLRDERLVRRANGTLGQALMTPRHAEEIHEAYKYLKEKDVTGARADKLVAEACRQGERTSGKPWKGLVRLAELVLHADLDPAAADFPESFHAAMTAPVHYTYAPGAEWVVRDYELGRALLAHDGRESEEFDTALLQQGRGSMAPYFIRAGALKGEVGRKYSEPLRIFRNSMVTADGDDHRRHRKAFLRFFTKPAVLDQAEFVEGAVAGLIDKVRQSARLKNGAFDFKKDLAFHFPIQVICHVLGIPPEDVQKVQRWSEDAVRAMDADAGLSLSIMNRGQRAAENLGAYLRTQLRAARANELGAGMFRDVAQDETLSEDEKVGNLSTIIFAGFETTTGLLSKGLHEILKRPEQWQFLQDSLYSGPEVEVDGVAVPDRELRWYCWAESQRGKVDIERKERIAALLAQSQPLQERLEKVRILEERLDNTVQEMLRWTAPGTVIPLTASRDANLLLPKAAVIRGKAYDAGETVQVRKGEMINVAVAEINRRCPFGGGNFDPDATGAFDVTRTDNQHHYSFGIKHMCIGAFLATENAKRMLEGVLRCFPDLEINGRVIPQDMELFSGLATLPVRSAAASRNQA